MKWKYIEGYDEVYKIYENGDVYLGKTKIEPFIHATRGTYYVSLRSPEKRNCSHEVTRLIYESFVDKIKDGTKLIYQDDNKLNYNLSNLKVINKYKKKTSDKPIKLDSNKIWKSIVGYEGLYKISNYGDIYSEGMYQLLKPYKSNKGYMRVSLTKNKKKRRQYVHLLVYITFKGNKIIKNNVIDHIDRNKTNN